LSKQSQLTGIVLKSSPLFDKDKRVELFTETHGKQVLLAKYAAKYGGKLDIATIITCQLYQGRSFKIITQCDLSQYFSKLRSNFNRISLAMHFIEIIRESTQEFQSNLALYTLLKSSLNELNQTSVNPTVKAHFYTEFLKAEGLLEASKKIITPSDFFNSYANYSGKMLREPITSHP